ncbi:MAG: ATP synthase F1 subunit gamma [Muribaculaceae bacterium]
MATLRELKGRIGSVASSEKITGAMKMISSAKMHKAEGALRRLKPYRSTIESIIANLLSADATFTSPLAEPRDVRNLSIVVLGSDDGLCGAYNVNLAKYLGECIAKQKERFGDTVNIRLIPVGKKMAKAVARFEQYAGVTISMPQVNSKSDGSDVKTFVDALQADFLANETDAVDVVYMKYISAGRQVATLDRLMPLTADVFTADGINSSARPYIFEPDAQSIFSTVLPMFVLAMTQEVFVENRASEQAARVMAMQAANDNAKKLLDQLRLEYNKLRQQSITTELLDIVGGQVRD